MVHTVDARLPPAPTDPGTEPSGTLDGVLWEALDRIAAREGRSVSALVDEIDRRRGGHDLTSALRTVALCYLRLASLHPQQPALLESVIGPLNPS